MLPLWFSAPVLGQGPDGGHEPHSPRGRITDRPALYIGQRISVSAIVQRVVGPRLFTVTATDQLDGDKEMLVFVPSPQLAAVRTDTRVMITGTVRPGAISAIKGEWGWDGALSGGIHFDSHEIIVAQLIIVDGIDMAVSAGAGWQSADSASTIVGSTLQNLAALASSDDPELVGRRVSLRNARISAVAAAGGFWVTSDDEQLFVLPGDDVRVRQGARVNIRGFVLELPEGMRDRLDDYLAARDEVIYIYANQVRAM